MNQVIKSQCPFCKTDLELEGSCQDWAGQRVECPCCKNTIVLPPTFSGSSGRITDQIPVNIRIKLQQKVAASAPPSDTQGLTKYCMQCGTILPPTRTVCNRCGFNPTIGKTSSSFTARRRAMIIKSLQRLVATIVVIAISYWGYAKYKHNQFQKQETQYLSEAISKVQNMTSPETAIAILKEALTKHSQAQNCDEARQVLNRLEQQASEKQTRLIEEQSLNKEMTRAKDAAVLSLTNAIAMLKMAMTNCPQAPNRAEAEQLVKQWEQQIAEQHGLESERLALAGEIEKAKKAQTVEQGLTILQDAIVKYPRASNRKEAEDMIARGKTFLSQRQLLAEQEAAKKKREEEDAAAEAAANAAIAAKRSQPAIPIKSLVNPNSSLGGPTKGRKMGQ